MIDKKSVIIGLIISVVLVVSLGYVAVAGPFIGVLVGSLIASYLANNKNRLKVVESALQGIIVGIFTGVVQILILYVKSGFAENIAGILMIGAGVIIGAYIIIGALGGLVGTLLNIKFGKSYKRSDMELEDQSEQQ